MPRRVRALASVATPLFGVLAAVVPLGAPRAQATTPLPDPARREFWWAAVSLTATAFAADAALERVSLANRSTTLDGFARAGHSLGAGRYLVPALGTGYVAGRLARAPRLADASLHAAAAYALGNVVASVGKPLMGRHRPDTTGSPWRFRPFARDGAHHSWPSAHALHAFTLAAAVAEESRRPWIVAAGYGAATLVAWSRVYEGEHWASDVVTSAVMGAAIGHATVKALHARKDTARHRESRAPALDLTMPGTGIGVRIRW